MLYKSLLATTLLAAAPLVAAHQNLHEFYVNGKTVGYEKCIRRPPSNSPVTDVMSTDIRCNVNGLTAAGTNPIPGVCPVNAGDEITVVWDTSSHPGPIQHFLYGPVSDALTADGSGAKWFKIHELSVQDGKMANVIMMENGGKMAFKLPANLESGDYLLRSEMLALHAAQTVGGAQFYIGCMQIKVTGPGGNCSPKFSLPGVYSPTETAIYIPNNYNGFNTLTYTAPGGPTATCAGGSNPPVSTSSVKPTSTPATPSTTRSTSTSKPASTTPVATPTPTGAAVPKYGQCGGIGYTGSTTCAAGSTCVKSNDYYSQCL